MESNTVSRRSAPVALTIAGSDSGANAGVQADLLSFSANGAYGTSAVTCITAQSPDILTEIQPLNPKIVAAQIDQVCAYFSPKAMKTGMLYDAAIVQAVCDSLSRQKSSFQLVVDPVMVASSGARLISDDTLEQIQSRLLPMATVITPNLDEAEILVDRGIRSQEKIEQAAIELSNAYNCAILIKGGHLTGNTLVDTLSLNDGTIARFTQERILDIDTHGSGCTLSATIAAHLARGLDIRASVSNALAYLRKGMERPVFIEGKRFINHSP